MSYELLRMRKRAGVFLQGQGANLRLLVIGAFIIGSLVVASGSISAQPGKGKSNPADATRVTIDVKGTDISRVLDAFSQQTGLSVVAGKEVSGTVSVRLLNVRWDQALDAILKPYGFGYERSGDVIIVLPIDKIQEVNAAQPLTSRVFNLKFVDAGDIKPVIEGLLSSRGSVQALEVTGQKGWEFGAFGTSGAGSGSTGSSGQSRRAYKGSSDRRSKTKTLIVSDISSVLERITEMIAAVDVMPKQILIESRFMEVNRDRLKDLGVDLATGSGGTSSGTVSTTSLDKTPSGEPNQAVGIQTLGSLASPSIFGAEASGISSTTPFNTGLSLAFRKLAGTQFDVLIHALEEDVHTNTLSAPSIMTLDNQEANILVGTQYPILTSTVAGTTSTTTVTSLDYYQDIGIQLRVVPQIAGDNHINMIVHPAVTSFTSTLSARSAEGTTLAEYPILITREAETQVLMKDGETIVIGGLLKDVKSTGYHKVPVLGDIPILGMVFKRKTDDIEKIDLLIFVTASIFKESNVASQEPVFEPPYPGADTKIKWQRESAAPVSSGEGLVKVN